jgi:hypothetical protein
MLFSRKCKSAINHPKADCYRCFQHHLVSNKVLFAKGASQTLHYDGLNVYKELHWALIFCIFL